MAVTTYTVINGVIVHEDRGGVERDYIPDTLGSTVALADASSFTDTWVYWPYGEVRSHTGTSTTSFTYVGTLGYCKVTTTSQMTYVRARMYMASRGRWATVDPLWPQELAYSYALCQPNAISDNLGTSGNLGQCRRSGSRMSCFYCAYKYYSLTGQNCPQYACKLANRFCKSHIKCGPCGVCNDPDIPGCFNMGALIRFGEFLRGSSSAGKEFNCSKSCGGWGTGDKLAHCFKGCALAFCTGVGICLTGDDNDPEDNEAEALGAAIGINLLAYGSIADCFYECANATEGMNCY